MLRSWIYSFLFFVIALGAQAQYPFAERNPVRIYGTPPASYIVHGVDVSRYQGHINWFAVRQAGIRFAYVKATEGGDIVDPMYYQNIRGAFAAKIRVGAYHFYHFCSTPDAQARLFSRVVERSTGWLPPVVDLEWNHKSSCNRKPNSRQMAQEVGRFLHLLEARYGQRPIIYTNPSFYNEAGLWNFRGYEFWLRSTAKNPSLAYSQQHWTFWQYTSTGAIPGINGNVDINTFAGNEEAWGRWLARRIVRGIEGVY